MSVNHQNKYSSTLAVGAAAGATTSEVVLAPTVAAPFYLIYDADNLNGVFETVYCTAKTGNEVTHAALTHPHAQGEAVIMSFDTVEHTAVVAAIANVGTTYATGFPTGEISMFGGSSVPTGFLECDGSAVSRTTYATLFAKIGVLFGVGDGSLTFNVPDLKGRVAVGYKSSDTDFDTVGEAGGANTKDLSHTHTYNHTHTVSGTTPAGGTGTNLDLGSTYTVTSSSHTHTFSATSGNPSTATTESSLSATQSVLNPYITLKFIIKT